MMQHLLAIPTTVLVLTSGVVGCAPGLSERTRLKSYTLESEV